MCILPLLNYLHFFKLVVKEDSKKPKAKASPKVAPKEPKAKKNQRTNRNETTSVTPTTATNNESKRSRNNINPANLNKKNQKGETPLHAACCKVSHKNLTLALFSRDNGGNLVRGNIFLKGLN
jgi:hypothetical protein